MHKTIEAAKTEALNQIRASRPQLRPDGLWQCMKCGDNSSDPGFRIWHECCNGKKGCVRIVR